MNSSTIRNRALAALLIFSVLAPGARASCSSEEQRLTSKYNAQMQRLQSQQLGMCQIARLTADMAREAMAFYSRCPSADPNGQMMSSMRQQLDWARQVNAQVCSNG